MRSTIARLIILFLVSIQAIEMPRVFAESSQMDSEITVGEVIVGGVAGHIIIDRTLHGLKRAYFEIEDRDFEAATAKLMPKNPKKVLYITSYNNEDGFYEISNLRFEQKYGNDPNKLHFNVASPGELISKLKALPQDSSFDLIEIDMHGNGGVLGFADGTILTRHDHPWLSRPKKHFDVEELSQAGFKIASPGARIRVNACRVADDLKLDRPIGKDLLNDLGKSLLPKGGQVLATEKRVVNIGFWTRTRRKIPSLSELQQLHELMKYVSEQKIPKGFRFRKDIVQIDIPPREPNCAPAVIQALQKALKK